MSQNVAYVNCDVRVTAYRWGMFSKVLEACADPQRLVAVGPPRAASCVSGSSKIARAGSAARATAARQGLSSVTVYVLDPKLGPSGQPRFRRKLYGRVTREESRALLTAGAVTAVRAAEILGANAHPGA